MHYLPGCKTLTSLSIEAEEDWIDNRFFGYPHPFAHDHPVDLLDEILGERGEGRWLSKGRVLWNWVSQKRVGDAGRGLRQPFEMSIPKRSKIWRF